MKQDYIFVIALMVIILLGSILWDRRIQQDKQTIESLQKEIQQLKESK